MRASRGRSFRHLTVVPNPAPPASKAVWLKVTAVVIVIAFIMMTIMVGVVSLLQKALKLS